jgi:hypothetical protein
MANDPVYDAVVERAVVHIAKAKAEFEADDAIRWRDMAPKVRAQVWVDALEKSLEQAKQIGRALGS